MGTINNQFICFCRCRFCGCFFLVAGAAGNSQTGDKQQGQQNHKLFHSSSSIQVYLPKLYKAEHLSNNSKSSKNIVKNELCYVFNKFWRKQAICKKKNRDFSRLESLSLISLYFRKPIFMSRWCQVFLIRIQFCVKFFIIQFLLPFGDHHRCHAIADKIG